jgi:hypothetical protein
VTARAPTLPAHCGSWVLVQREPRKAVQEMFSRKNADKMARILAANPDASRRYELVTAADWLRSINGH